MMKTSCEHSKRTTFSALLCITLLLGLVSFPLVHHTQQRQGTPTELISRPVPSRRRTTIYATLPKRVQILFFLSGLEIERRLAVYFQKIKIKLSKNLEQNALPDRLKTTLLILAAGQSKIIDPYFVRA